MKVFKTTLPIYRAHSCWRCQLRASLQTKNRCSHNLVLGFNSCPPEIPIASAGSPISLSTYHALVDHLLAMEHHSTPVLTFLLES